MREGEYCGPSCWAKEIAEHYVMSILYRGQYLNPLAHPILRRVDVSVDTMPVPTQTHVAPA